MNHEKVFPALTAAIFLTFFGYVICYYHFIVEKRSDIILIYTFNLLMALLVANLFTGVIALIVPRLGSAGRAKVLHVHRSYPVWIFYRSWRYRLKKITVSMEGQLVDTYSFFQVNEDPRGKTVLLWPRSFPWMACTDDAFDDVPNAWMAVIMSVVITALFLAPGVMLLIQYVDRLVRTDPPAHFP